jgi:hypothetical protein
MMFMGEFVNRNFEKSLKNAAQKHEQYRSAKDAYHRVSLPQMEADGDRDRDKMRRSVGAGGVVYVL